jgi:ribonuclease-3
MGFDEFLILSKGESRDTGKARAYILANTYEAFIGALYLDQGYDAAEGFVHSTLITKTTTNYRCMDYGVMQKALRSRKITRIESVTPSYQSLHHIGPDHDKIFTVGIFFGTKQIAEGKGSSKQEAETDAARNALESKRLELAPLWCFFIVQNILTIYFF